MYNAVLEARKPVSKFRYLEKKIQETLTLDISKLILIIPSG